MGESDGKPEEKQAKKKGPKDGAAGKRATVGVGAGGKVNFDELSEPSEGEEADVGMADEDQLEVGGGSRAATRWGDEEEGEYEDGYVKRAAIFPETAVYYLQKERPSARGFRVEGSGWRVQGGGFRVEGSGLLKHGSTGGV